MARGGKSPRTVETPVVRPANPFPPAVKPYTTARTLRGRKVYYQHSASEVLSVRFVRWVRARMHTGGEDSNDVGVGTIVWSPWLCGPPFNRRPPHGFAKGHFQLRPYWRIFRSYRDARMNRRPINPPPVARVRSGIFAE